MSHIGNEEKYKQAIVDAIQKGKTCIWNRKVPGTRMEKFRQSVNQKYNLSLENYWDLYKWSMNNCEHFWEEIWIFFGIISSKPYSRVMKKFGIRILDVEWFVGARLNFAENLLRFRDARTALICIDEDGQEETVTYAEMYEEVKVYAAAFKKHGLRKGDVVACYSGNMKEAVFSTLAASAIGAIFGGYSSQYGAKGVTRVITQMKPKFLLTCDTAKFQGVEKDLLQILKQIASRCSYIEKILIVATKKNLPKPDISNIKNSVFLDEFLESAKNADGTIPELTFEQLPLNHPIFIIFTSGTTGIPKGIVHAASALLSLARDVGLHYNLSSGDVVHCSGQIGLIMWLGYNATFMVGGTILLLNGRPYYNSQSHFWDMLSKYKVTYVHMAASIVDKLEKFESAPGPDCNLENLKFFGMGSSPVKLQNYEYVHRITEGKVFIGCMYATTEIMGRFSGFDFNEPTYSGEVQFPSLGMSVKCLDNDGKFVVGKLGNIVVERQFIGMPLGILGDNSGEVIKEMYLSEYPGAWSLHDSAWMNPNMKALCVVGRNDAIMNPRGRNFNATDIYEAVHAVTELMDYLCVPQNNDLGDQRVILFVKTADGIEVTETLIEKIGISVKSDFPASHVPSIVLQVTDIPYNFNDKRMESVVRYIVQTNEIPQVHNIRNPECLPYFCGRPELQNY